MNEAGRSRGCCGNLDSAGIPDLPDLPQPVGLTGVALTVSYHWSLTQSCEVKDTIPIVLVEHR